MQLTLGSKLLVFDNVDEVLVGGRILALYTLRLLSLRSFCRPDIKRNTAVVFQIDSCRSLDETYVFIAFLVPSFDQGRWITAWLVRRTPSPQLITCPVEGFNSMALRPLRTAQRADVDQTCANSHRYGRCFKAGDGDYGTLCSLLRERRTPL